MRHRAWAILAAVLVLVPPAGAAGAEDGQWDDKAVEAAIRRRVEYLWSQWTDGHWPERGTARATEGFGYTPNYGGVTALCAYALLTAGESAQSERMKQTLQWLAKVEMHGTYARALRANVWAALGRGSKYRGHLLADVKWLTQAVDGQGAYDYCASTRPDPAGRDLRTGPRRRFDNSNTQLALLGVWAGARAGVHIDPGYWRQVERHWKDCQNEDGGWSYGQSGPSYGSMTVAGLASMFICFDALYMREFIECKAETDYRPIVKGLEWMDRHFAADCNPGKRSYWYEYYLYGVERVGLASGHKYFGKKDWYKLGAKALIGRRNFDSVVNTSFALLFLARGRNPVLFNKLKYPGTWNCRPRDLANLTAWITRTFEKPVNWQIIHLDAPVSQWHDAPILYISGASAPDFSDEHLAALKQFVQQGGVIFSEAAGNRTPFTLAMTKYYAKMFPDYELKRLGDDHPVYRLGFETDQRALLGISNGVRLLAIHSPAEVSLSWQLNEFSTRSDLFKLAANVYFFVSDKGSLRKRGATHWPVERPFAPAATVRLARVKYAGNYDPEPLALQRFAILMGNRHRLRVNLSRPMDLAELDAARWPVALMSGTAEFTLTQPQRQALKRYLAAGGTLVAEAAGGNEAFAAAIEKQLRELFPKADYGLISSGHDLFTKAALAVEKVRYRRALSMTMIEPTRPRLRGLVHQGRLAAIVSADDLSGGLVGFERWGLKGYSPQSAFEIMRNIVLYANGKTLAAGAVASTTAGDK